MDVPDEDVYGCEVDCLQDLVWQASDITQRSLEPVSTKWYGKGEIVLRIALCNIPRFTVVVVLPT